MSITDIEQPSTCSLAPAQFPTSPSEWPALYRRALGDQVRDVAIDYARRHFEFTGNLSSRRRVRRAPQYPDDLE
jgi:hypothetical protein